ncbi:MAG: CBS domain-containing protein [Theionarchaea archaeon]|nr:CBS domain-containing protein [Theionarchaea archaeon]MBU7000566.1 CBS domain-containing protein [Theionarchaea archaeon]MBU7020468.1 CBS domain-containing protein [Theionarchaea archaeon]MBU7035672.1 CBS domain-containing protein [Theionarchaea archaeon]MBU7041090.1 CBS domain-containing protein [Theionarchaea archaeon]
MPIKRSFLHEALEEMKTSQKAETRREIAFPSKMKVKDIMRDIHEVREDMSLQDLLHELKEKEETCFTVVSAQGDVVGLVTESDLMKLISKPLPHTGIGGLGYKSLFFRSAETVGDIMTRNPICISPEAKLEDAARIMRNNKIRHLPVTKNRKCIGLIGVKDLLLILRILM